MNTKNNLKWSPMFILVLSLITINGFGQGVVETWNHKIVVTSGTEEIDDKHIYTYSTTVYNTEAAFAKNLLVKKFKEWTEEKVTSKKVVFAKQVDLPRLGIDTVDIIANSISIEETDNVKINVAFVNGAVALNPDDYPEGHKIALDIIYELGVTFNQSVVSAQIATAKVDLSTLENKQFAVVSKKESLERALESSRTKLTKLKEDNSAITTKLAEEKAKAAKLKVGADAQTATNADLDEFDAATKEVSKVEAQLLKNEQAKVSASEKIEENDLSLKEKMKEVEEISSQLTKQEKLVASLEAKYKAIK